MRLILTIAGLALALGLAAPPASAALPPGISGAWYNPAQSGHGLTVEILDGNRALVFWHVFDPDGNPIHLYIEGDVVGHAIAGQAYLGRGMPFGSFDRDAYALNHWGGVTLTFTGCDVGRLDWQPDGPAGSGYPEGSMPLQRLTGIAGMGCHFSAPGLLPAGRYEVSTDSARGWDAHAAVDSQGRLWATTVFTPTSPYVGPFVPVLIGVPDAAPLALRLATHAGTALAAAQVGEPETQLLQFGSLPDGSVQGSATTPDSRHSFEFEHSATSADPLHRAFALSDLQGLAFEFEGRAQFFWHPHEVRFLAGAEFCIDTDREECAFRGSMHAEDPGLAMFSFTGFTDDAGITVEYRGKGWVEYHQGEAQRVVLVASATDDRFQVTGLGVVAERAP